jgi:hypothetical protein
MSGAAYGSWSALFLLGAYHGINPGMGWLFAVARGMQEHSGKAVIQSLGPITVGHALSIGVVVFLASMLETVLPFRYVKFTVAGALVVLGLYRIVRNRHFRWGGMQVSLTELTLWSFLMASAHGAGLMVMPLVWRLGSIGGPLAMRHMHAANVHGPVTGVEATLVHTLGYLTVTAGIALLVYRKLGLALLRKAWFNLDLIWAVALLVTGCIALAA